MNPTFLNDLQLDAGFYPLASLLTDGIGNVFETKAAPRMLRLRCSRYTA